MMRATVRAVGTNRKTQSGVAPLSFRLTREEHQALKQIAEREHRSMSGQLRAWIKQHREPVELEQAA